MEELYRTRPLSVEEPGVAVDDLRGDPRTVGLHHLAAGAREPAFEDTFEARAVEEPDPALALGLPEPHVPFVGVAVRELVLAAAVGSIAREASLVAVAVLPGVGSLALLEAFVELAFVAERLREVLALAVEARAAHRAAVDRAVGERELAH